MGPDGEVSFFATREDAMEAGRRQSLEVRWAAPQFFVARVFPPPDDVNVGCFICSYNKATEDYRYPDNKRVVKVCERCKKDLINIESQFTE
jgi:hypothetical protein